MATKLDLYKPDLEKRPYFVSVFLGVDQLANAILGGYVDETLSSRAFRCKEDKKRWKYAEKFINTLFFWDKQITPDGVIKHCELAYYGELLHETLPKELRG